MESYVNKKSAFIFRGVKLGGIKTKYLTTGLSFPDKEFLALVRAAAKKEGRSFSNFVCQILKEKFPTTSTNPLPDAPDFLIMSATEVENMNSHNIKASSRQRSSSKKV